MLPNYLVDLKHVKQNHDILSNMKAGITKHLKGQRKFNLVVAREIVCMLASSSSNGSNKDVVRVLGVDKCNIRKALGKQVQLDTMKDVFGLHEGELNVQMFYLNP
jgi:hypothetical protein